MKKVALVVVSSVAAVSIACMSGCSSAPADGADTSESASTGAKSKIKTVFVIVMENHDWASIQGSSSAPYINGKLLPQASFAQNYQGVPGLHPSSPNYIWLEAGDDLGITDDKDPSANHQATKDHLVSQIVRSGRDWRSYQESIDGTECPLSGTPFLSRYVPRHNPAVYFDDVTDGNDPQSANCIRHVRPFGELSKDLRAGNVAAYNFITPDLCHDMHGQEVSCLFGDQVKAGDTWLSKTIPLIQASAAYKSGGAIFITFDENEGGNKPIGMIVVSPFAKGGGYTNTIAYTHSSTLRTIEDIFHLTPLRGAATSNNLNDLFRSFP